MIKYGLVGYISLVAANATASCLEEAATYADRICGALMQSGSSSHVTAGGELTAEAKGIILRALGGAGAQVDVNVLREKYTNVVRSALPEELKSARSCRIKMEGVARAEVCVKPVVYKTCADPSFGIAKWGNVEQIPSSTGWRSGWTQPAHCTSLTESSISARSLGGKEHKVEVVATSEEGRWRVPELRIDRQYRYHCTIKLSYNPIYNKRQDNICGVQ